MRVGFIGCVHSSALILETLFCIEEIQVCGVLTKTKSSINSDFVDLTPLCVTREIPVKYDDQTSPNESVDFFINLKLDVILCVGWSHILREPMLTASRIGVIGFHPARLPQNRGRHPIIWSLALGLENTASSFFLMDTGADSGPIIAQQNIEITLTDNAQSLYQKIMNVAVQQVKCFLPALKMGTLVFKEQDENAATYWRKRSRRDGTIDFRMAASAIFNLVRALSPPYPGAEVKYNDIFYKVLSCRIDTVSYPINTVPGQVIKISENRLLAKVYGDQAVWLELESIPDIEEGQCL